MGVDCTVHRDFSFLAVTLGTATCTVLRLWFAMLRCCGKGAMQDNFGIFPPPGSIEKVRNTAVHTLEITGNMTHSLINILDPTWWWRYCFRWDFSHFDLPKMRWRSQWSDSLRFLAERPGLAVYVSQRLTHTYTRMQWQPGEQGADFSKQTEKTSSNKMILMYYSCLKKKILKWSISGHWNQVIIHQLPGLALGRIRDEQTIVQLSEVNMVELVIHMYVNLPNLTSTNVLQAHKGFNTEI